MRVILFGALLVTSTACKEKPTQAPASPSAKQTESASARTATAAPVAAKRSASAPAAAVPVDLYGGFCCCMSAGNAMHWEVSSREYCTGGDAGECDTWSACGIDDAPVVVSPGKPVIANWEDGGIKSAAWAPVPERLIVVALRTKGPDGTGALEARVGEEWQKLGTFEYSAARGGTLEIRDAGDGTLSVRSDIEGAGDDEPIAQAFQLAFKSSDPGGTVTVKNRWSGSGLDKAPAWAK